MGRERREFLRRTGFRDAILFVIATEGADTEQRYFAGLKERLHSPRIHIELISRIEPGQSSPEHVLRSLDEFAGEWNPRAGDELWLVIDRDRWQPRNLANVARECERKQYSIAVSNPCFELWLLVHLDDIPNKPASRKRDLFVNKRGLLKRLVAAQHRPNTPFIDHYFDFASTAIARSQALDVAPGDRWPNQLDTRVYRLVERLRPRDG